MKTSYWIILFSTVVSLTFGQGYYVAHNELKHDAGCPPTDTGSGTYLPDLTDCTNFFQCAHGMKVRKVCPANLHFNTKLNVCDYPENAGCQNNYQHFEVSHSQNSNPPMHNYGTQDYNNYNQQSYTGYANKPNFNEMQYYRPGSSEPQFHYQPSYNQYEPNTYTSYSSGSQYNNNDQRYSEPSNAKSSYGSIKYNNRPRYSATHY